MLVIGSEILESIQTCLTRRRLRTSTPVFWGETIAITVAPILERVDAVFCNALDLGVIVGLRIIVVILRLGLPVNRTSRLVRHFLLFKLLLRMLVAYEIDEVVTYACLDFGPTSSRGLIDEIGVEGTGSTGD